MELDYVVKAVRRFWPIVALAALLGIVAALVLQPDDEVRFEASAMLLVAPPADSEFADAPGDRYISSQLVVLESPAVEARALELGGVPMSELAVDEAVVISQLPGTDVVRITATAAAAADAQALANGYLDAYLERTGGDAAAGAGPQVEELEQSIGEIGQQLDAVDARIRDALAPFVEAAGPEDPVPTIDQIAPALVTEREVLLEQYRELLGRRASLQFDPPAQSGSQVIERAELPELPIEQSSSLVTVALPFVALLLGVVAATVLARTSRRVLDAAEVTEVLEVPFAADVPHLRRGSARVREVVNELCVQIEALGRVGRSLRVVVTGSQPAAGTTSLAAAIAARFGGTGSLVALLDLDLEEPDLSDFYGVEGDDIGALARLGAPADDEPVRLDPQVFTPTPMPNVVVVGRRAALDGATPRRIDLMAAFDTAALYADVVVVDAGPMLAASASAVLAAHADAIVLAVPVRAQRRAPLQVAARQLAAVRDRLLPVAMPRLRSSRAHRTMGQPVTSSQHSLDEVREPEPTP